jgi:hypothetical protein
MKLFKTIMMLSFFAAASSAIAGDKAGNGGGGLCKRSNGGAQVCKTIAEAGIRVSPKLPSNSTWLIPASLFKELEIFAYSEVTTRSLEAPPFSIVEAEKTFLLPQFFMLSERRQAMILIHEANIRAGASLSETLEFDELLLENMRDPSGLSFNYPRFIESLRSTLVKMDQTSLPSRPYVLLANLPDRRLHTHVIEYFENRWVHNENAFVHLIKYFEKTSGRALTLGDFRFTDLPQLHNQDTYNNEAWSLLDPAQATAPLRAAYELGNEFYRIFHNSGMTVKTHELNADLRKHCVQRQASEPDAPKSYTLVISQKAEGTPGVFAINCQSQNQPALSVTWDNKQYF